MNIKVEIEKVISAPAEEVWRIVAHKFDAIGSWATAVPESRPLPPGTNGDAAAGRVCETQVPGFNAITETITYYDENGKRFGYEAAAGNPWFVQRAENNWHVIPTEAGKSLIKIRGRIVLNPVIGIFMRPFLNRQLRKISAQTIDELKFFIENGRPHPRKQKQLKLKGEKST